MQNKWYTLHTRENAEKKVVTFFLKRGIQCCCPLNRMVYKNLFGKVVESNFPLFKEYVFVQIEDSDLSVINQNKYIVNFVFWLGRPVILSEFEIINIKKFVSVYKNIYLEKTAVKLNKSNGILSNIFKNNYCDDVNDTKYNSNSITIHSLGFRLISNMENDTPTYKNVSALSI